jgi:hypothetical protein
MEIAFENKYYSNDKMLSEYINKVILKGLKFWGRIVAAGALLLLIYGIVQKNQVYIAIYAVVLFIVVAVIVFTPSMTLKELKESDKKIHRRKKRQTKVQFGDKIYLSEGTFSLTIEYDQIIKQYDLEHSYVLMFGKKNGILVEPNSFTRGNFEDFKEFINTKTQDNI